LVVAGDDYGDALASVHDRCLLDALLRAPGGGAPLRLPILGPGATRRLSRPPDGRVRAPGPAGVASAVPRRPARGPQRTTRGRALLGLPPSSWGGYRRWRAWRGRGVGGGCVCGRYCGGWGWEVVTGV